MATKAERDRLLALLQAFPPTPWSLQQTADSDDDWWATYNDGSGGDTSMLTREQLEALHEARRLVPELIAELNDLTNDADEDDDDSCVKCGGAVLQPGRDRCGAFECGGGSLPAIVLTQEDETVSPAVDERMDEQKVGES